MGTYSDGTSIVIQLSRMGSVGESPMYGVHIHGNMDYSGSLFMMMLSLANSLLLGGI